MKRSGWSTESRHKRGYGSQWDKIRKVVLARDNGLCQCRECQGGKLRVLVANEVHHVVSKDQAKRQGWTQEQTDALSNLISINSECHKRETAAEQGRQLRIRQEIGVDGWPV